MYPAARCRAIYSMISAVSITRSAGSGPFRLLHMHEHSHMQASIFCTRGISTCVWRCWMQFTCYISNCLWIRNGQKPSSMYCTVWTCAKNIRLHIHGADTRWLLPYAACRTWAESSGVRRSLSSQAPESSHVQIHQRMRGGRSRERERCGAAGTRKLVCFPYT
jgi:hypothetical protein